jgi:hypothetical protein
MNLFLLYLWLKLDLIRDLIIFGGVALIGFGCTWYLIWRNNYGNEDKKPDSDDHYYKRRTWYLKENACRRFAQRNRSKWYVGWYLGGIIFFLGLLIPSQEDSAYLVAGYAGMQIAQSTEMSKVTELLRLKVNSYLDKQIQEVKGAAQAAAASAVGK